MLKEISLLTLNYFYPRADLVDLVKISLGCSIAYKTSKMLYEKFIKKSNKETSLLDKFSEERNSIVIPITHTSKRKSFISSLINPENGDDEMICQGTAKRVNKILFNAAATKTNIDIILDTPGGSVSATKQICDAILTFKSEHPDCKVTVFIPFRAFSGGSVIMLLADELHLGKYAFLSPVDPQLGTMLGQFSLNDITELVKEKGTNASDLTLIANSMGNRTSDMVSRIINKNITNSKKFSVREHDKLIKLFNGGYSHSESFCVKDCEIFDVLPDKIMTDDEIRNFEKMLSIEFN